MQNSRTAPLAFALALAALPSTISAQPRVIEYNPERSITVAGEASVNAAPDFARVTLGVTTAGKEAREAMALNARSVGALVSLFKGEGVAPADIRTSGLSISPIFADQRANPQGAPAITGYTVTDTVTVTVRDLPRLGAMLDKAVEAGANTMYGVAYGENDTSALLDKARTLAVADAKRKAEIYASAAGSRIGRLMELSEETIGRPSPYPARVYAQTAASSQTPVEPGSDKLTVTVTARFELTQ